MTEAVTHPLAERHPPSWASEWGEDRFGVFTAFRVGAVAYRLRWIPPGEAALGSPEGEHGRFDGEERRDVVFDEGFWLGETTVTQALWEAVMGVNPSRFVGAERPVENVSWEDAREFLARVNKQEPGLELTFPTDAQWEYACRAGTTTPFSFGEDVTSDEVNFDGNHPYRGTVNEPLRQETVPVGSLPANSWGLREMHGNVWEWCEDEAEWSLDVGGRLVEAGPMRVLRGGSWDAFALFCRSAYRGAHDPSARASSVGLRLCRSPVGNSGSDRGAARSREGRASDAAERTGP